MAVILLHTECPFSSDGRINRNTQAGPPWRRVISHFVGDTRLRPRLFRRGLLVFGGSGTGFVPPLRPAISDGIFIGDCCIASPMYNSNLNTRQLLRVEQVIPGQAMPLEEPGQHLKDIRLRRPRVRCRFRWSVVTLVRFGTYHLSSAPTQLLNAGPVLDDTDIRQARPQHYVSCIGGHARADSLRWRDHTNIHHSGESCPHLEQQIPYLYHLQDDTLNTEDGGSRKLYYGDTAQISSPLRRRASIVGGFKYRPAAHDIIFISQGWDCRCRPDIMDWRCRRSFKSRYNGPGTPRCWTWPRHRGTRWTGSPPRPPRQRAGLPAALCGMADAILRAAGLPGRRSRPWSI